MWSFDGANICELASRVLQNIINSVIDFRYHNTLTWPFSKKEPKERVMYCANGCIGCLKILASHWKTKLIRKSSIICMYITLNFIYQDFRDNIQILIFIIISATLWPIRSTSVVSCQTWQPIQNRNFYLIHGV